MTYEALGLRTSLGKGAGKGRRRPEEKLAALQHRAASALNDGGPWAFPFPTSGVQGSRTQNENGERGLYSPTLILHQVSETVIRERKRCLQVIGKSGGHRVSCALHMGFSYCSPTFHSSLKLLLILVVAYDHENMIKGTRRSATCRTITVCQVMIGTEIVFSLVRWR